MEDSNESRPPTWREKHFASIMGGVLGGLLLMIIVVQVAC
jgi:hypothetical protein